MRVALLSHNARFGDAIGRQLAEKVAFFLDRGADLRLYVESVTRLHPGLKPHVRRVTADRLPPGDLRFLESADLIVVEYSQYFGLLDLLPILAGGKAKVVFDFHGVTPPHLGGPNLREALRRGEQFRGLVWYADGAIAHSRFTADELRAATDFPAAMTHTLGYPLDTEWFTPGPSATPFRRQTATEQARVLLFVGRLAPNKRLTVLIEALAELKAVQPPVHAWILGDSGDCYEAERRRCRELAAERGVADRLHFLGHVDDAQLRDAYRDADILVMPSIHEGHCLPVVEAQACGLPVLAARATALPETVGAAGLTFRPDDDADLARQVRRLLAPAANSEHRRRIAVVAPRYGDGFVGGAESSLRLIAETLHAAGYAVEVYTTTDAGTGLADFAEGNQVVDGVRVRRFRPDPSDTARFQAAVDAIRQTVEAPGSDTEATYLYHSLRSTALLGALTEAGPFDAIVVGPYLLGLTRDVTLAFQGRTLLLPSFHDEPFARLPALFAAYESVGGVLYHSAQEQLFAEATLGLNQPNAVCLGTWIADADNADAGAGRARVGAGRRYLLYCGRFCREKDLPNLLDFAGRYAAAYPERFVFAFAGQGDVAIPGEAWARDLGFLATEALRDVIAGADAVVNLSANESLSLAILEAQSAGVPVIVRADNPVLTAHLANGAGRAVAGYDEFATALDDLWRSPQTWRADGLRGRASVRANYGCRQAFVERIETAIRQLDEPLADLMRRAGSRKAALASRPAWRDAFGRVVEQILHAPARPRTDALSVEPRTALVTATAGEGFVLLPVRLTQHGRHPDAADGPGRTEIVSQVFDESGTAIAAPLATALPDLLLPGQSAAAVVQVRVPETRGEYSVAVWTARQHAATTNQNGGVEAMAANAAASPPGANRLPDVRLTLSVQAATVGPSTSPTPILERARTNLDAALRAAHAVRILPDGYTDVSAGWGARWKRWLKQKLLHNFQHAYVNVLSRQQSDYNRHVVNAVAELAEGQDLLGHALQTVRPAESKRVRELREELSAAKQRIRRLERRLERVEGLRPSAVPRPKAG